jgi:PiT family inorganic phosphate transporter
VVGLIGAALLLAMRALVRVRSLYTAPVGNKPPPLVVRALLVLTCPSVSFAHGSNDGQKGMGLIMLILIGALPTACALNRAVPESQMAGSSPSRGRLRRHMPSVAWVSFR